MHNYAKLSPSQAQQYISLSGLCCVCTICCFELSYRGCEELYEARHEISNNVVCTTSKASDQPAHMRGLIRAFASRLNIL